jgi:hypothetical protein
MKKSIRPNVVVGAGEDVDLDLWPVPVESVRFVLCARLLYFLLLMGLMLTKLSFFSKMISYCDIIDGEVQIGPVKEFNRKAKPGAAKKVGENDDERRKGGKQSLRLGTSRKGRAAEASNRRGSLKRRDRRSEKERKAEAAIERKTIQLPEYVNDWYFVNTPKSEPIFSNTNNYSLCLSLSLR